jgi:Zn-dependent protease
MRIEYRMSPSARTWRIGPWKTSEIELQDLFKSWLAISVAFGIVLGGVNSLFSIAFLNTFILAALTVGVGFIFHEMGHKIVAQRYGCFAEFRAFNTMLVLAIAMSFFGFVFAAPGAVMIAGGNVNRARNGRISIAGALVNLVLAGIFIGIHFATGSTHDILRYGFLINTWLALFNMFPFGPLDGKKVLAWNKGAWLGVVAISIALIYTFGTTF